MKTLNHFVVKSFKQLAKVTAFTSVLWVGVFAVSTAIALGSFYWETKTARQVANENSVQKSTIVSATSAAEAVTSESVNNGGWGSEALEIIHSQAQQLSPIALANACGLGASSCFRCHNDKRAKAPNYSAVDAPWHAQHKSVNYSCTGCHKGNPRILKQEIAHKNLIVNAVAAPEQTCSTCHSADDIARLIPVYRASHPRLFEISEGNAQ